MRSSGAQRSPIIGADVERCEDVLPVLSCCFSWCSCEESNLGAQIFFCVRWRFCLRVFQRYFREERGRAFHHEFLCVDAQGMAASAKLTLYGRTKLAGYLLPFGRRTPSDALPLQCSTLSLFPLVPQVLNASGLPATFPRQFTYFTVDVRDK